MYQINLDDSFESNGLRFKRRDTLSEIVSNAEKAIRQRFASSNFFDKDITSRLIDDFCTIYASLYDKLVRLGIFSSEGDEQMHLSMIYSLYKSSVAATNILFDDSIDRILQAQETPCYFNKISEQDMSSQSDQVLLSNLLEKIEHLPDRRNPERNKYNLYNFFDTIRVYSKNILIANCSPKTLNALNAISITLKDLDFKDYSQRRGAKKICSSNGKQVDNKVADENLEKLPGTLPMYISIYPEAEIGQVIGNAEPKKLLLASITQATDYNPVTRRNPHSGLGYIERVLIHGIKGTGKNFTVDAAINAGKQISKKYGTDIEVVILNRELRSIYKDRVAQLFAHFADLELKSNGVYLNLINEADGLFGVNTNGRANDESNKLIADAKEVMDATSGKGVIWWLISNNPGVFEAAFGDRLISIAVPGAQTQEEYTGLFRLKLGKAIEAGKYSLTENELKTAVNYFIQKKGEANRTYGIVISGRGVAEICENFTAFNLDTYLRNMYDIKNAPADRKQQLLYALMPEVNYRRLMDGIDMYIQSLIEKKETQQRHSAEHMM